VAGCGAICSAIHYNKGTTVYNGAEDKIKTQKINLLSPKEVTVCVTYAIKVAHISMLPRGAREGSARTGQPSTSAVAPTVTAYEDLQSTF
jgi:hypothetical protein